MFFIRFPKCYSCGSRLVQKLSFMVGYILKPLLCMTMNIHSLLHNCNDAGMSVFVRTCFTFSKVVGSQSHNGIFYCSYVYSFQEDASQQWCQGPPPSQEHSLSPNVVLQPEMDVIRVNIWIKIQYKNKEVTRCSSFYTFRHMFS